MSVGSIGKALIFTNVTVISNVAEGVEQGAAAAAKIFNAARGQRNPAKDLTKGNKPTSALDRNPRDAFVPSNLAVTDENP